MYSSLLATPAKRRSHHGDTTKQINNDGHTLHESISAPVSHQPVSSLALIQNVKLASVTLDKTGC